MLTDPRDNYMMVVQENEQLKQDIGNEKLTTKKLKQGNENYRSSMMRLEQPVEKMKIELLTFVQQMGDTATSSRNKTKQAEETLAQDEFETCVKRKQEFLEKVEAADDGDEKKETALTIPRGTWFTPPRSPAKKLKMKTNDGDADDEDEQGFSHTRHLEWLDSQDDCIIEEEMGHGV